MKKLGYVIFFCTVTVVFCLAAFAQPTPGTYVLKGDEAGEWAEFLVGLVGGAEGQPGNQITALKDNVYEFGTSIISADDLTEDLRRVRLQQVAKLRDPSQFDKDTDLPFFEYRSLYNGGRVKLFNNDDTEWYNPKDTSEFFTATLGVTRVLTRKFVETVEDQVDEFAPTGGMAFLLTAIADFGEYPGFKAYIVAWFKGEPSVGKEVISGKLDWVKITICGAIEPSQWIPFVIKPGSCRNPLNVKSRGVLPAVIAGTSDFDVNQIDPDTIKLFVDSDQKYPLSPLRWAIEDVVTWEQDPLNTVGIKGTDDDMDDPDKCNNEDPDDKEDIVLKFSTPEIVKRIWKVYGELEDGQEIPLRVEAKLKDGSLVAGRDKVTLLVKGRKFNRELVREFIKRFYGLCLSRLPEEAGWNDWTDALASGTLSGSQVAAGFISSKEFKKLKISHEQYLIILYKAFFDRDPDERGFNEWLTQLKSGKSRDHIFQGFIASHEFITLCDKYGINPN